MPLLLPTLALTTVALAADAPFVDPAVEADGVRIESQLESQVYTWTVTATGRDSITGFSLRLSRAYDEKTPPGWEWEVNDSIFRAWVVDEQAAIRPGRPAIFSARAASSGPALAVTAAEVTLAGRPEPVRLDVWAPGPKPRGPVAMIVATISLLALLHAFVQARVDRRRQRTASSVG